MLFPLITVLKPGRDLPPVADYSPGPAWECHSCFFLKSTLNKAVFAVCLTSPPAPAAARARPAARRVTAKLQRRGPHSLSPFFPSQAEPGLSPPETPPSGARQDAAGARRARTHRGRGAAKVTLGNGDGDGCGAAAGRAGKGRAAGGDSSAPYGPGGPERPRPVPLGNKEWVRREGTAMGHLEQPPCSSGDIPEHVAQDCSQTVL